MTEKLLERYQQARDQYVHIRKSLTHLEESTTIGKFSETIKTTQQLLNNLLTWIEEQSKINFFCELPPQIILSLMDYLTGPEIRLMEKVCVQMNQLLKSRKATPLWRHLYLSEHWPLSSPARLTEFPWRTRSLEQLALQDSWSSSGVLTLCANQMVPTYALSFQQNLLVTGGLDYDITLWSMKNLSQTAVFRGHTSSVYSLCFYSSRNKDLVLSASADSTAKIWSVDEGTCLRTLNGGTEELSCIQVQPATHTAFVASHDGVVYCHDLESGTRVLSFPKQSAAIRSISLSENQLLSGTVDENLFIYDVRSQALIATLKGHEDSLTCVHLDVSHSLALSSSSDGELRRWELKKSACLETYKQDQKARVNSFAVQGTKLLAGTDDGRVVFYKFPNVRKVRTWVDHGRSEVEALQADESRLVSADSEGHLFLRTF